MGQTAACGIPFSAVPKTAVRQYWDSAAAAQRPVHLDLTSNMLRRRAESVQRLEAFADVPMADCVSIVTTAQEKQYQRSFTVFSENEPAEVVVLLLSGCMKLMQRGANEQDVILRLNGPGEWVGGVDGQGGRSFSTARAVQPSSALVWQASIFQAALERFPILRRNVSHAIERQLDELDIRFREIATEKVASRLSSLLIRLVKQVGRNAEGSMEIALSRQELAQLTGTTLFTVSRLLCRWEEQGVLSARREAVLIHDLAALQELSQQE
jgi:CRP-like cAMP-binding protein